MEEHMVTTIRDNIAVRLLAVLGSEFSKLSYMSDVSQNKFGRANKRFGVIPKSALATSGVNGLDTLDHSFEVILTDGYLSGALAQINDELKTERIGELQDRALLIYKDLQVNKGFLDSKVLIVNGLSMSEIEYLDEEKVAILRFEINIKYKT
jgi:hypothetical protein